MKAILAIEPWSAVKALLLATLLAGLIFAHGCHRHDDNELFTSWAATFGK